MRWPRRRKDASPSAIANAHAARRVESWRHLPRLVPPPSGPAVAHALEFSRSIAAARPLTQRVVPDHERAHVPEPVGLVHVPVNVYTPLPVALADDNAPIDERAFEQFPPRPRPRRLPTVPRPHAEQEFLRAPDIDLVAIEESFSDDDEPNYQPPAPETIPEAPARTPREMRVFRPRRLGLGEPLALQPLPDEPGSDGADGRAPDGRPPDERPRAQHVENAVDHAREELERADGDPPPSPPAMRTEAVPTDLRTTLSDAFGVTVGDGPVYRGPQVSERARDLNARAFTYKNEVFLPDELGPLGGTEARATLAHELTHVAQQRVLTTTLPDEGTEAGHRLEAAAQSVELFVRGASDAPRPTPELLHPDRAREPDVLDPQEYADLVAQELARRGLAHRDAIGDLVIGPDPSTVPSSPTPSGVQRQAAATEEHTLGTRLGNLGDMLLGSFRADVGHTVLDEWNLDPRLHRQLDLDNESDIEERRQLRLINEHISRDNERRLARHEPAVAHVDGLSDAQRREIRAHVEQRLTEHDRATPPRTTSRPTSPPGRAPTTGAPGTHPAASHQEPAATGRSSTSPQTATGGNGEAHDLGTPLTGEQRRRNLRELGTHAGMELGEEYFALFGLREFGRRQLHEAATPHTAAAATPAPATGHTDSHPSGAEALHQRSVASTPAPGATQAGPAHAGPAAPAHGGAGAPVHAAHDAHAAHDVSTSNFSELEDHQVEELVRRVYARLRTTLRMELLVDRERAGMLADFR
jgi:hypothetical protein